MGPSPSRARPARRHPECEVGHRRRRLLLEPRTDRNHPAAPPAHQDRVVRSSPRQPGRHRHAGRHADRRHTRFSNRNGNPLSGFDLDLTLADNSGSATTNAAGRAARTVQLDGLARTEPGSASFAGTNLYGASTREITFIIGDDAAVRSNTEHSTVGGITRLGGTVITHPSGSSSRRLAFSSRSLSGSELTKDIDAHTPPRIPGLAPVDDGPRTRSWPCR